jgi:hypothetical protein
MTRKLFAAMAVAGGLASVYARWIRPWHERWGAASDEITLTLPGDGLLAEPATQVTRAITIDATPQEVWPWIVQLGADRGGFYTYQWLENLFGLGIRNADGIVDHWQDLEIGDVVYLRPHESLTLQVADLGAGRPLRRDEKLRWEFQWTFALRDAPGGGTRLLVRERVAFERAITRALMAPIGLVSFVMTRGMLLGIRSRAEAHRAPRRPTADARR